jgi:hypothetical protein
MFDVINILLWITLVANMGSSPTIQKETGQKETGQKQVIMVLETQNLYQQNPILSKDYTVAKQALDKAIAERDEATIRLGLKGGSVSFQKDIVQAVRNAWYQSFVPDLIVALEDNQVFTIAKAENTSERQELKKVIVSALMHLTGLRFPNTEELSKNDVQKIVEESREWYRANEPEIQQTVITEMLEKQQATPILSKNYRIAKAAFDKAVLERDKATIRLGLKRESLSFKAVTVQAIKQFEDKSFVPDLIKALEGNQVIMSGGLETQVEQQELNKEIISALKQLTGLNFSYLNDSSTIPCFNDCPPKDIIRVLKESREWWRNHKKDM